MKLFRHILLAAVAVAAISCSEEISPEVDRHPENNLIPMTFTAVADSETKVAYDGQNTFWQENDEIMVIAENGVSAVFTVDKINDNIAIFKGELIESDTYYAVYPASAYLENNLSEKKIYAKVPNKQKAVAGSFDKDAFLSIASNGGKGNKLQFKNSCTVIGFQLAEPAGVKSVRFTANGQTNIAGNGVISTENIPIHSWDNTYSDRSSFDMITLEAPDGGFQSNTDYFLTIRAGRCPSGVKVYVEYNDGVKSRTSTNPLFGSTENYRSHMRHLGKFDTELTDMTPYESYQMGFDLVVGNNVYNKSEHGDAVRVTADGTSLYTAFNKGGIRFLDPAADGAIVLHSTVAVTADAILVGNVTNGKVLVDMNGKNVNHTANTVALKNLELDTDSYTNYVFANNNATADAEAFILDNCTVNGLVKPLWFVNTSGYTCKNITLVDTDISLSGGANIIDLSKTTSSANKVVNIKNCILYAASNTVSRIVNNTQTSGVTWDADVIFENNTVFNLHAGTNNGLLHMSGAKSVVFKNNLINFYGFSATEYVIRIWKNNPIYTIENNHFWARGSAGIPEDLTFYSNVMVESATANITSGAYPFTSNVPGAGATR